MRLAIFDCDGTLVDSQHAIVAAMTAGFAAEGLAAPDPALVRRVVGLPLVGAVAMLLPEADPALHERVAEAYKAAFFQNRTSGRYLEPLYPGVREALDALEDAGVLLGIATGKSRRGLVAILEHHGLLDRFVTLQTSDLVAGKPNPDMVIHALSEAGVEREAAVVIGDTTFDVLMARNARVRCVGVTWGYHEGAELVAAGANCLVDSYAEVPSAVLGLMPSVATQ
ncbi:HAD-IA family hydrolase [Aerophototrophica crusticola]|uniref:HAD-IA family hydrolase n=1 Tax=Aerophototrophica crusticola TaxID=1709002 RepID=A0A858R7E7_9PROT|nr:HAD-IA family hydrolase [Rhodospirillaceae bacterium B3]